MKLDHIRKRSSSYLIFFVCFLLISMVSFPVFQGNENSNKYEDMMFSFTFSDPNMTQSFQDHEMVTDIHINGLSLTNNYLEPILPVKPINVLLPCETTIDSISIHSSQPINLGSGFNLRRSGAVIPIEMQSMEDIEKPAFFTDQSSSAQDEDPILYEIVGEYVLRGYSILTLNVYPIDYRQDSGSLRFFKNIEITISVKSTTQSGIIRNNDLDQNIINKYVINKDLISSYNTNKKSFQNEMNIDYVIITNEQLKNADVKYSFHDFVDYKKAKGINATIVTVEEIENNLDFSVNGKWGDNNPENPFFQQPIEHNLQLFDDTQARIRNFIRYAYSEWNTDFVLLAGDADTNNPSENIIPLRGLYADEKGLPLKNDLDYEVDDLPSDVYYACLDGNFNYDQDYHFGDAPKFNMRNKNIDEADLYAEVFVGRACVDHPDEVSNFVYKAMTYDAIQSDEYLSKILFIGERLGSLFYFEWGGGYKDLIEYLIPPEYTLIKLYQRDGPWDYEFYQELLNDDPPLIINHDGHGSPTSAMGLTCRSIAELSNEKYYFIYSHTCLAGSFDNCWPPNTYYDIDCVAEFFTVETKHGAIAVVMNSRYGLGSQHTSDSPSGVYDESFFKALFQENITQFGPANHFSKEDNIWQINENGMRWAYYETNLFGDPELSIKKPTEQEPVSLQIDIVKPSIQPMFYAFDTALFSLPFFDQPVIGGDFTIMIDAKSVPDGNIAKVSLFIDDKLVVEKSDQSFSYVWDDDTLGMHTIKASLISVHNESISTDRSVLRLW